jgi:anti-sigma factor RsiW
MSHLEKFDEWLPWYVNGTLNAKDRAVMDAHLAATPAAREELRFYERMTATMKRRADSIPEDIGLAKTLARIQAAPRAAVSPSSPKSSAADDESWFSRLLGGGWMKPALGFAMAVILGQSVLLVQQREEAIVYRSKTPVVTTTAAGAKTEAAFLRVVFKASATEGELRLLLASTQAWVAGGPGQAGEYYLRFAPDHVQSALEALKASGVVSEIAPVDQVPAQ